MSVYNFVPNNVEYDGDSLSQVLVVRDDLERRGKKRERERERERESWLTRGKKEAREKKGERVGSG